jgi:hypothetical protein
MRGASLMLVSLVSACVTTSLDPIELDDDDGQDNQLQISEQKDVDILFVIDNSGSMGEEQANLAANFAAFIEVLEAPDVEANYRIGVTTTDRGNPWCQGTTPEGGQLVMSPCTTRLADFVFEGADETLDAQAIACTDICTLDAEALVVQPSVTELDPNPSPRPWLERLEGHSNLPDGTTPPDAFACFGPQGIDGCGFEAPLESMLLALSRSNTVDEPSYGFLRDAAILAVVFVTDEVDCSYDKAWEVIFEPDNTTFWTDPAASYPSSGLCWNAGVECSGDPSGYDGCKPVNKGADGQLGVADDAAVLYPVVRYVERLAAIEADKQLLAPDNEVIVALIGGVQPDGSIVYAEQDSAFGHEFGIGPGCTGPLGEAAVPPVRIRALVDEFTPGNLHSICAPDYTGALAAIADAIRSEIKPACYGKCVADTEPDSPLVQPSCTLERWLPGASESELVPECLRDDAGAYVRDPSSGRHVMPSDDASVCFGLRVDADMASDDPLDDISDYCRELGLNLEFELAYRAGEVAPSGQTLRATCELSSTPALDCPQ